MNRRVVLAIAIAFLVGWLARGVEAATPPSVQPVAVDWRWQQVAPATAGLSGAPRIGEAPQGLARTGEPAPRSGGAPSFVAPAAVASSATAKPRPATPSPKRAPSTAASGRHLEATERHVVAGTASWYCKPGRSVCTAGYAASGPYAAAGPALRVGNWRGRWVKVNGIRLRLIDFCACPRRVIDVYGSQFAKLAPLSRGVIPVEVRW